MTRTAEDLRVEDKLVVVFDICSSSNIIEDLSLTASLKAMRNLLISIKRFLREKSGELGFELYKFTGDGWILLFAPDTGGRTLMGLLADLSKLFHDRVNSDILPRLETKPQLVGITFGVDRGPLVKMTMMRKEEYIGRPLNIACRLQNAIKDKDPHPQYKVLMSNHVFVSFSEDLRRYRPRRVTRTLRNIRGGQKYECVKLDIPIR